MKPNKTFLVSAGLISSALALAALLAGCYSGGNSPVRNVDATGNRIGPPPESTPAKTNTPPAPATANSPGSGMNSTGTPHPGVSSGTGMPPNP